MDYIHICIQSKLILEAQCNSYQTNGTVFLWRLSELLSNLWLYCWNLDKSRLLLWKLKLKCVWALCRRKGKERDGKLGRQANFPCLGGSLGVERTRVRYKFKTISPPLLGGLWKENSFNTQNIAYQHLPYKNFLTQNIIWLKK